MKKVLLKINAKQSGQDGEEDIMELVTKGKYYKKKDAVYLVYEESELSGMEGCVTTLKIKDGIVKMKRYGTPGQEISFETGKKFLGIYETPVGLVDMEILTKKINNTFLQDEKSGKLTVEYDISLRGLMEARNSLTVELIG